LYILLIAKINNYSSFGWGPRYLIPVLPVIFFVSVSALMNVWNKLKIVAMSLIAASVFLNALPVVVNWHAVVDSSFELQDPMQMLPLQHLAALEAIVNGKLVVSRKASDATSLTSPVFPDFWLIRLAEMSSAMFLVSICLFIVFMSVMVFSVAYLFRVAYLD
jgi:hypothetical protein